MYRVIEFRVDSVVQRGRCFGRNYFDKLTPQGTIEHFAEGLEDVTSVLGLNASADIPVGTTFTSIRLNRLNDGSVNQGTLPPIGRVPIALTLTAIEFYGRTIDVVPSGSTARLTVQGHGLQDLVNTLVDASEHEYVSMMVG